MSTIRVRDRNVHYELRGQGPLVVLLHSIGVDQTIYDRVVDALVADHTLLRFDLRGHGRSDLGDDEREPSLQILAEDLHTLLAALDVRAAHLVGQSIGAMTLLAFACEFPDWPGTLVVLDGAAHSNPEWDERYRGRAEAVLQYGMSALTPNVIEQALGATTRARRSAVVDEYLGFFSRARPDGYAWACRAMVRFDLRDRLRGIRRPMHVAVGEEDVMTTMDDARTIASLVPGATLTSFPGTGHVPCLEAPERVGDLIREWVRLHAEAPA